MRVTRSIVQASCAVLLLLSPAVAMQEVVIQYRSGEDPSLVTGPAVCAGAPFAPNVVAGASLWSIQAQAGTGAVVNRESRRIGSGVACILVTDFGFSQFSTARLYSELQIGTLRMKLDGPCTVTTNDVPLTGVILAGCALEVVDAPSGFVGGIATSNSVFNPFQIPGFSTGSYWTLRLYGP